MSRLKVSYTNKDFDAADFHNEIWKKAEKIRLNRYWSGAPAEDSRHSTAQAVWSENAFYVRFEGTQIEPLFINNKPSLTEKATTLWERDVFEIFIAVDEVKVNKYFEFEVAPTGEWLDVKLEISPTGERKSDFRYVSGMKTAALVEEKKVLAAIKVDWDAFGKKPQTGDIWRGNLFRCVGAGQTRGYLAWQPTKTETPNFHVPGAFGRFEFVKQ